MSPLMKLAESDDYLKGRLNTHIVRVVSLYLRWPSEYVRYEMLILRYASCCRNSEVSCCIYPSKGFSETSSVKGESIMCVYMT